MRILKVLLEDPENSSKGDAKILKGRRNELERLGNIVDVLSFSVGWGRTRIKLEGLEGRNGVDIRVKVSWISFVRGVIEALGRRKMPLQCAGGYGYKRGAAKELRDILGVYDVIHYYHIRSVGLIGLENKEAKVVFDLIDSYSLNLGSRLEKRASMGIIRRAVLQYEYNRIRSMESGLWEEVGGRDITALTVSERDMSFIDKRMPRCVIPLGVKIGKEVLEKEAYRAGNAIKLIFFGNLGYGPNIDACKKMRRLAKRIKGRKSVADIEITLAGRNARLADRILKDHSIRVVSPVGNMEGLVKSHDVSIIPIDSGSGMQSKLLESIAWGVPVITTEFVARQLGMVSGRDYLEANDEDEMVECIEMIFHGDIDLNRLSRNARRHLEKLDWTRTCLSLLRIYDTAESGPLVLE